ncbi:MAG: hypothetical protein NXI16_01455 [Alphaproteobacteria bacterium]|nr:hypothetical protein [Alphaproteobacteria bacterium]
MDNTEGFTQAELDTINGVLDVLAGEFEGLEGYTLNDTINNQWRVDHPHTITPFQSRESLFMFADEEEWENHRDMAFTYASEDAYEAALDWYNEVQRPKEFIVNFYSQHAPQFNDIPDTLDDAANPGAMRPTWAEEVMCLWARINYPVGAENTHDKLLERCRAQLSAK